MTEDILFDNIYVGHSVDDAKAFAAETFDVKHSLEKAADKSAFSDEDEVELDEVTFTENPVDFLRNKAFKFIALARTDPIAAWKAQPETGVALVGAVLTFFGMVGALFGLVGSQQKTVVKVRFLIHYHLLSNANHNILYGSLQKRMTHPPPMIKT
jgi:U5 small nuclear ribonucleoprotein component